MKKPGKLQINTENLLNSDELISLKGGIGGGPCSVICYSGTTVYGHLLCLNDEYTCTRECQEAFQDTNAYSIPQDC